MKGKMKKIIAGIATLAMAAQFAFVLPASAATLYSQDFEDVADAEALQKIWTAQDTGALKLITGDATYGKYMSYDFTGSQANSRGLETNFAPDVSGKEYYVVEFDALLKAGNGQTTNLAVKTSDFAYDSNNVNYGAGKGYLFKMAATGGSTKWAFNDTETATATIPNDAWCHYKLIVNTDYKLTSVSITNGSTSITDKLIVGINGSATDIKGVYALAGRYQAVIDMDNIVVRDKEDTDVFGELPTETLSSLSWTTQVNRKITQPAENEPVHIPITVRANGSLGHDLADKATITWSTLGLSEDDGYVSLTKEAGTEAGTMGESPDGSATAYLNVRNGVGNWYGSVTATVTYDDVTKTIDTPFAIIGASGGGDNIAPAAGYPENFSDYAEDVVGYKSYDDSSLVLSNWGTMGSSSGRYFTLAKDEDGTKYLKFVAGTGGSNTVQYSLADQTSQYIVDMKVRFLGDEKFGHCEYQLNNGGQNENWLCSLTSGTLSLNGTEVATDMANNTWYRVVVSCDESTEKCWAKVYNADGSLKGETADMVSVSTSTATDNKGNAIENGGAKYKRGQKYFCTGMNTELASFRVYKPSAATVTITGADSIGVPGYDEKALKGKGIEDSTLYTYDATAHTLTVTAADIDAAKLIVASYDKKKLTDFDIEDLTFTSGSAVVSDFTLPDSCRLMLWKPDLAAIEPLKPVEGTGVSNPNLPALTPATAELNAIAETSEGFIITGDVNWASDSEDSNVILTKDNTDSHKATLTVKDGAPAGTVTVTASSGAASGTHEVGLTTSGNSIATTATATSLTIPFAGEESVDATFTAKTVDKDAHDVEFAVDEDGEPTTTPAAITWSVLDKNLRDITNSLPAGITWDAENHKITVTDQAKATVIYVQAKNNDATPLSRNIKVNIHGMSFAFGTDEPAEGFTQVTATDAYTEKLGYGFSDASVVKDAASNVSGSADYRFKATVPNGNYTVKVTTSSASITSEVVETVTATTGIGKSGSQFNVAVADGVLDLTFASGSTLSSIEIEQAAAKTAGEKPSIYAIGDSTTNNTGNGAMSWGNYFSGNVATLLADTSFGNFSNNGMAGRDSVNFYNQGRVEAVLLAVRPGDYVTINMGINSRETGEGASYETLMRTYYIDAVAQRGAIPVIVTATPDGPVGTSEAADYNTTTGKFTNNRGDGACNNVLRKLAKEKGYNLIELGQAGEDWLNESTLDELKAYGGDQDAATKLALVQSWYVDHNHYKEPMAKWISEYMIKVLDEIAKGSTAYKAVAE